MIQYTFDYEGTQNFDFTKEKIESHKCTEEELGLNGSDNAKFYPLNQDSQQVVGKAKNFLYCFDLS